MDNQHPIDWQEKTAAERLAETLRLNADRYGVQPDRPTDRSTWPIRKLRFPLDR